MLKGVKEDHSMIYMFNFVIEPEYQNKGYGSQLLKEFIKSAKEKGYKKLLGHFRQNSSLHLVKKLGAKEKKTYKNWCKTKENYTLCELVL
jgi:ribosomal protein S18 acetylase RimI-like enzyme